jgi:hypothetical protein
MRTGIFDASAASRMGGAALLATLLSACCGQPGQPACNNPLIKVDPTASGFNITGSQFSGGKPCARISMTGFPGNTGASGAIVLGDVNCAGGNFPKFVWNYSLFNCTPSSTIPVNIIATDQVTLKAAIQAATMPWGPGCGLVNYTPCGGEGELPCQGGACSAGPPDLHPDLQGGTLVCTANCGHTQGYSPCVPGMDGCPPTGGTLVAPQRACLTKPNGIGVFSCFDHSMIGNSNDCRCVPNTLNLCKTNTSAPTPPGVPSGFCVSARFSDC